MNTATLGTVVRKLRAISDPLPEPSDQQLLAKFSTIQDQTAFSALVRRHGPMVLGVLRRALRHEQDAEDAFQATFLVLARSAGSIRDVQALPSWLHGVSRRIAMKTKRSAARRRNHEGHSVPKTNSPASELDWREVQAILDDEVARLATVYRTPFILCCLEGAGRDEAAKKLGLKDGTLSSRLAKARAILKDRLARRGITLSAVLASIALDGKCAIAAPLAEATVQGSFGKASPVVLALARGMTPPLAYARIMIVGAILLVAGLCAGVSAINANPETPATPPITANAIEAKDVAAEVPAVKPVQPAEFEIVGTIVGPDGKPVSEASVILWTNELTKRADVKSQTTTGGDGKFTLRVPLGAVKHDARLVVTAKGLGAQWIVLSEPPKTPLSLSLPEDDLPISGRILDLEGKPIVGAKVTVTDVERLSNGGDLQPYVDAWMKALPRTSPDLPLRVGLPSSALAAQSSTTTDTDGRFTLKGFGRERMVQLNVRADGAESMMLTAMTHLNDPVVAKKARLYGANFELTLGPGKAMEGTVTERATGKPVAGVEVSVAMAIAVTDDQGRYRLDGLGKRETYFAWAMSKGPYFPARADSVQDSPGLEPIKVDFVLERGILISGKLRDKSTGKPVAGVVWYGVKPDNPVLKTPGIDTKDLLSRFESKADGSFHGLVIAGPAYLAVQTDENRFARATPTLTEGEFVIAVPRPFIPQLYNVIVGIDPVEKNPESLQVAIDLEAGASKKGVVVGPDGKPVEGAMAFGLTAIPDPGASSFPRRPRFGPPPSIRLKGAEFTATGLNPKDPRCLVIIHPEKKLGKIFEVRGDEKGDLTIPVEPLGSVAGRLLNSDGSAGAGLNVAPYPPRRFADYKRLPFDLQRQAANRVGFGKEEGKWLPTAATTDKDGKFQLDGLLPGMDYELWIRNEPTGARFTANTIDRFSITVETGKIKELGDRKLREPRQ
jgi:RNA polymerase sigma factor (sigma-70 family)